MKSIKENTLKSIIKKLGNENAILKKENDKLKATLDEQQKLLAKMKVSYGKMETKYNEYNSLVGELKKARREYRDILQDIKTLQSGYLKEINKESKEIVKSINR